VVHGWRNLLFSGVRGRGQRVEKVGVSPVGDPREPENKAKTLQERRIWPLNRGQKRARRGFSTRWVVLRSSRVGVLRCRDSMTPDGHAPSDRSTCGSSLRSITMPGRDRKGQTRREAGAQSSRTSGGGGRVAEPPTRARPAMGPPRVGAQRRLEECPGGHAVAARDGSKYGPGEARTPP
jgi:hypothetical protein